MEKNNFKAMAILEYIGSEPKGRRLSEIQRFIFERNHPDRKFNVKTDRGYYCTCLFGVMSSGRIGLLESFCLKNKENRYQLVEKPKAPFYRNYGDGETKTFKLNRAARRIQHELMVSAADKCKHHGCQGYKYAKDADFYTPDGNAHFVCWGRGYKVDCSGRVWMKEGKQTDLTKEELRKFEDAVRNSTLNWGFAEVLIINFLKEHSV